MIREQLVNQKVQGRGANKNTKGVRSGAKGKSSAKHSYTADLRELLDELREIKPYLMIAGLVFLSLVTLVLLYMGYRSATYAAFFQLKEINVNGYVRTSSDDIKALTRRVIGKQGVWNADISALQKEIEKLPWIRSAIVSRVLPDGIRIRVIEREPKAVVGLSKDRNVLVDEDANILAPATSKDKPAPFILHGWDESVTDSAKEDNRERIESYSQLAEELSLLGLASRVRDVNLEDINDVRVNVAFADSMVEFRLGSKDFGNRLKYAIDKIDIERGATDFRCIAYVDVRQGINKGNRLAFATKSDCSVSEDISSSENTGKIVVYNELTGRNEIRDAADINRTENNTAKVETKKTEIKKDANESIAEKKKTDSKIDKTKNADSKKKTEQTNNKTKQEQSLNKSNPDKNKTDKKPSNAKETRPRKV